MDSHEAGYFTPSASSTAPAPSTFRLLKSIIFSSAPSKHKHAQSPRIPVAPSSASRDVHLFPASTSSSEHIYHLSQTLHPEQKVPLVRQRSKSNNMFNRHNELSSPQSTGSAPSVDQSRPKQSFELLRTSPSVDLLRPAPSTDSQWCAPTQSNLHHIPQTNRIMVDINSQRLNYPSFNNKAAAQNGPRVLRLVSPLSNSPSENHSSHAGSSHRPTPIPHGGSGAILTINAANSIRLAALPPSLRHHDIASSLNQFDPIPSRSESLNLNEQYPAFSAPISQDQHNPAPAPSPKTLDITPSGKSTLLLHPHHSPSQSASGSDKQRLSRESLPNVFPDFTPRPSSSSSLTTIKNVEPPTPSLAPSSTALSQQATPQSYPDTIAASKPFDVEFSEFADFLSYPDRASSKPPTRPSLPPQSPKPLTQPSLSSHSSITRHSHSSLASNLSSKPSTPQLHYPTIALSDSNERFSSSLPSTPAPIQSPSAPSPSSLRTFDTSQYIHPPSEVQPPSIAQSSSSLIQSPQSTASSSYSSVLSPSSPLPYEALKTSTHSTTSTDPSSALSLSSGSTSISSQKVPRIHPRVPLPHPRVPLPEPPQSPQSQSELEHARKIILGLQNEVKQLKAASTESNNAASEISSASDQLVLPHPLNHKPTSSPSDCIVTPKTSTKSDETALPSSLDHTLSSKPSDGIEQFVDGPIDHDSPSMTLVQAGLNQKQIHPLVESSSTDDGLAKAHPQEEIANSDFKLQSEHEHEYTGKPSRLPVAKYRLRVPPLAEVARNLHSRTYSGASTMSRSVKLLTDVNGSTEYRSGTPQSHSTHRTARSPISTSFRPQLRKASSGNPHPFPGQSRPTSPQGEEAWSRKTQDAILPDFFESSSQASRSVERNAKDELRRQVSRPLLRSRAPSNVSHSSSSSGQLAHPHASTTRSRRYNGSTPSIHDNRSYRSESVFDSVSEYSRHHSRRHVNRDGLSSVAEGSVFPEQADQSTWSTMTKTELLVMLKNQQTEFALEREELLDALRRSKDKVAQSSHEAERLRAEDGWKTEQLNKAREEISWLSRLADVLELDKLKLEKRVKLLASELKGRSSDYKKVTTPNSSSSHMMQDGGPMSPDRGPSLGRSTGSYSSSTRSGGSGSLSRSTSKTFYSPKTPSPATHRVRHLSGDSVRTILANVPSRAHESQSQSNLSHTITKWRARKSPVEESDPVTPGTRQHSAKHRFAPAQHSATDFRVPSTTSNFHSPRSEHAESLSSRQRGSRPPSASRSIGLRQFNSEYQHSEAGSSEDGRRADTIIEERDDQVHRSDARSEYSNAHFSHNLEYEEAQEPLDYQDVAYEIDAHKGHSRHNSGESLAISPSSTVFADHQRNDRSRISMYNRHSQNLNEHSNSRNSLISLQLRPEDELFLENYLDDDGIPSDDDF